VLDVVFVELIVCCSAEIFDHLCIDSSVFLIFSR